MSDEIRFKNRLCASELINEVRACFKEIDDTRNPNKTKVTLSDALMSGYAVFSMKSPSLLDFEDIRLSQSRSHNLKSLYGIGAIPSDTRMREIIDEVDTKDLRHPFRRVFRLLDRSKVLHKYKYLNDSYLLLIDGTGYFSSTTVHCDSCMEKHRKDGSTTYYHQALGAVIAHPDLSPVIPLCPEPIIKQDGSGKNDCESNAAKRLLADIRREHPHLRLTVVEDSLSSKGPHIKLLKQLNYSFIIAAKPGDHRDLFERIEEDDLAGEVTHHEVVVDGITHRFRFTNGVALNTAHPDLHINFLEYWEINSKGKTKHFSWVTDIEIDTNNLMTLMKGGRARWSIENETFNTLKNQGYQFEHNFGHGEKNLSVNFMILMMLAFLVDQVQLLACEVFQAALEKMKGKKIGLWNRMRQLFDLVAMKSWEQFFTVIIHPERLNFSIDSG